MNRTLSSELRHQISYCWWSCRNVCSICTYTICSIYEDVGYVHASLIYIDANRNAMRRLRRANEQRRRHTPSHPNAERRRAIGYLVVQVVTFDWGWKVGRTSMLRSTCASLRRRRTPPTQKKKNNASVSICRTRIPAPIVIILLYIPHKVVVTRIIGEYTARC